MKHADFGLPVDRDIDIGHGITITLAEYEGEIIGLTETHKDKTGAVCRGFVRFDVPQNGGFGAASQTKWKIEQANPLTLSPSILCRSCGNHGFIREGKWVPA